MKKVCTVSVLALTTLSFSACDGGAAGGGEQDTDPLTVASSQLHVLGSSESIAEVLDLDVAPDGSVWVLNSLDPFFIGFDPSGAVVGMHGAAGGGPEQFRMPSAFLSGGLDGGVWVLDVARNAFMEISHPEGAWTQLSIPRDALPPGSLRGGMNLLTVTVRTARLGDEIIVPKTTGSLEAGLFSLKLAILQADLVALDPKTGSVRDVVALGQVLDDPTVGFEATDGGIPLWYRLWDVCGDEIRVYDRVRNQLRGFSASGGELEPVELPPVQLTTATPRQFAGVIYGLRQAEVTGGVGSRLGPADSARVMNEVIQGVKGAPEQLAAYLPRYVDFRCTDDGTMWLRPIDLDVGGLGGGPTWYRIQPDGTTREVRLPARFDPMRFTRDRAWGVLRDEFDVASVAWIELPQ